MFQEDYSNSILSKDYQRQLSEQLRQQLRVRMILIQAQWINSANAVSHRVNCSTGFLISPNLILTAAHNIFNKITERFANRIQLYFLHKNEGHSISIFSQKIIMDLREEDYRCETIMNNGKLTYANDYAMIKIDHKQGKLREDVEYLRFKSIGEIDNGSNIFLSGFPDFSLKQSSKFKSKKKEQITKETFTCLKEDIGKVEKIENNSLYYHIITMGGQSGSPLFVKDKETEGLRLVGVHNSYNNQKQMGKGVFFNDQNLTTIQRWIDELTNEVNEDRVARMVESQLQSFSKYANCLSKKIDKLVKNNYSLFGSKFRQTKTKWQSFWQEFQRFKEKMQGIYKVCSQFYTSPEEHSILQVQESDSQNSQIKFQDSTLFEPSYLDQQFKYNQEGQRCDHHKEPVYYYNQDNDKVICNRCVLYKKSANVRCMVHGEEIKFVQINDQSGDTAILQERQIYLCKTCMEEQKSKEQLDLKYQRIDHYYHRPISYLKLLSSEYISKSPSTIIDIQTLLLSDDCALKNANPSKGRDAEKYTASQLLDQGLIEIKDQELQRLMFRAQSQDNAIIDKHVTEIQAMLAHFSQTQQRQHNHYLQRAATFFEAFSDMLHCRSKHLRTQLLDYRTDDQECLKIIQKISIMKLHCFNQQSPTQLLTFLDFCIDYLEKDIAQLALMKGEVISKLNKDIQSFIFHGGTIQT